MTYAQDTNLDKLIRSAWHYKHCTIEVENDPDCCTTAWCEEHHVDVTEPYMTEHDWEPDPYDNSEENLSA